MRGKIAHVDPVAEDAAIQRFRNLAHHKTSLIISHRFPIARLAEHIVVIEDGQIREEGNHSSLIEKNGRYAQLLSLQAKGYI